MIFIVVYLISFILNSGLVFTKGLRLSHASLRLKSSLKVKTFVSAKFCLKIVFTKGDLDKPNIIK